MMLLFAPLGFFNNDLFCVVFRYIHDQGRTHGSLYLDNIMVVSGSTQHHPKIILCDFGESLGIGKYFRFILYVSVTQTEFCCSILALTNNFLFLFLQLSTCESLFMQQKWQKSVSLVFFSY